MIRHEIRDNGVLLVTIDNPDRANAITPQMDQALVAAWALAREDKIRVVVVTGSGFQAFCTGVDIHEYFSELRRQAAVCHELSFLQVARDRPCEKPVIAAINGLALGGGLEIALAADIRIASSHAKLGLPEVRLGVIAGAGGATRLPRSIPNAVAADMLLTGEAIDAERALAAGLVSRVVGPSDLVPTALTLAGKIASEPQGAVQATLALLRGVHRFDFAESLDMERKSFRELMLSSETEESVAAFIAKRRG